MDRRIAYFVATYPALTQTFVHREIEYLRVHDVEVSVFAVKRPLDLEASRSRQTKSGEALFARPDNLLLAGVLQPWYLISHPFRYLKCLKLIARQLKHHPLPVVFKLCFHLFTAVAFCQHLKKLHICHIHAHFATASTIALFCHYLMNISFSFTAHATADIYVNPLMLEEKITAASGVITISEYNRAYLNLLTDYACEDKIEVIYNGVEVEDTFAYEVTLDRPLELVSVGAMRCHCKGYPTLIKALAILRDKGYEFHCSIIGDGVQRQILVKLIDSFDLNDQITLSGSLEHPLTLSKMKQADIFILAAEIYVSGIRDGVPTVCTEAMALGIPVISTFISGIPELIENGKSGMLVPEKDCEKLSYAIAQLIDDPKFRYELAINGYERVKQHFNAHHTIRKLYAILDNYLTEAA